MLLLGKLARRMDALPGVEVLVRTTGVSLIAAFGEAGYLLAMPVGLISTVPVFGTMFLIGTTADGEPTLTFVAENPEKVQGFDEEIDKVRLERFHLESYRADHVLRFGGSPFFDVVAGDRPDFTVSVEGASVGLDCAAFADHHRRLGFRLMDHLRQRLADGAGGRDFSGVAGCVLSVWFGTKLDELPPKRWDDSIVEPLLDAIAECKVDRAGAARFAAEVAQRGFPQSIPPTVATGRTPDEVAGFVANLAPGADDRTQFSTGLPFDVLLHLPEHVTYSKARAILGRIVAQHDQPFIQRLLLSAGAPDRRGIRFPAEEAIAGFLTDQQDLYVEAENLTQVTLHLWSSRRILDVPVRPAASPSQNRDER